MKEVCSILEQILLGSGHNSLEYLSGSDLEGKRNEALFKLQLVMKEQLLILIRKIGYWVISVIWTGLSFLSVHTMMMEWSCFCLPALWRVTLSTVNFSVILFIFHRTITPSQPCVLGHHLEVPRPG